MSPNTQYALKTFLSLALIAIVIATLSVALPLIPGFSTAMSSAYTAVSEGYLSLSTPLQIGIGVAGGLVAATLIGGIGYQIGSSIKGSLEDLRVKQAEYKTDLEKEKTQIITQDLKVEGHKTERSRVKGQNYRLEFQGFIDNKLARMIEEYLDGRTYKEDNILSAINNNMSQIINNYKVVDVNYLHDQMFEKIDFIAQEIAKQGTMTKESVQHKADKLKQILLNAREDVGDNKKDSEKENYSKDITPDGIRQKQGEEQGTREK